VPIRQRVGICRDQLARQGEHLGSLRGSRADNVTHRGQRPVFDVPSENFEGDWMNGRGFGPDGDVTVFQIASQNEGMTILSTRFKEAVQNSPSVETEECLDSIIQELAASDDAKVLRFQCRQEIAKSKIERRDYKNAIPYLVQLLKTDEFRADIWVQLAICSQQTDNANLFLIAVARVNSIRPQLQFHPPPPSLPPLILAPAPTRFVGYSMVTPCWRLFLQALDKALKDNPFAVPVFQFAEPPLQFHAPETKWDLEEHRPIRFQSIPKISKQRAVTKLGDHSLCAFLGSVVAREFHTGTWTFSEPVLMVAATLINKIASEFRFADICPRDISLTLIEMAVRHLMTSLTPTARLFMAELASAFKPERCSFFLKDVIPPALHHQHALLRIAIVTLEESIRNNLHYTILERQLRACRVNLTGGLFISHAGVFIDEKLLEKKEQQIETLKMIATRSPTVEGAENLFRDPQQLQFLSLANIAALFLHFDDDAAASVFPSFLRLLPELIRKENRGVDNLAKVFDRIRYSMSEESVTNLFSAYKALGEVDSEPELCFSAALSIARASQDDLDKSIKILNILHKELGKRCICHAQDGNFLEYLLDALLPRADGWESEITQAFTCYFSDIALTANSHRSQLHLRCSRFLRPFYEHLVRLDDKLTSFNLFSTYLAIWKHWKSGCGCLESIDGWRMYRSIKKRANQLQKRELPEGFQSQEVLEDLLRNDPVGRIESRIALAKVLIRSFVTSIEPQEEKLDEAIRLLELCTEPHHLLIKAIVLALRHEDSLELFTSLPSFSEVKPECRRLYWTMRLLLERGDEATSQVYAKQAAPLLTKALPPEFALLLGPITGYILRDNKMIQHLINMYCKAKPLSPYPYVYLAKLLNADHAFKLLTPLIRTTVPNIINCFYFDFKPPFLMARPDDGASVRREVLQLWVDMAAASGNYLKLFPLFNPSGKLDQRASRVLNTSRVVFGVDRISICEMYLGELVNAVERKIEKGHLDRSMTERVLDALVRGQQIDLSPSGKEILGRLLQMCWRSLVGKDPTPDITVHELMKQLIDTEEEEDDEEEDEEFVDSSGEDAENESKSQKEEKRTSETAETTKSQTDEEEETSEDSG
jgi:hypothetical protein